MLRTDQEKNDTESRQSSLGTLGKILHEFIKYTSSRNVSATPGGRKKKKGLSHRSLYKMFAFLFTTKHNKVYITYFC